MAAKTGVVAQNREEGSTATYNDGFNPPLGGEQQSTSREVGEGKKGEGSFGKTRREKKKPKIKNKATEDMDFPMENQETADVLANAATNAVNAKVIYTHQTKIGFPVAENIV
eukprot:4917751-Ditylum_brightwellii.AAC.1